MSRRHVWKHNAADPPHMDRCACGAERRAIDDTHYEFRTSSSAEWRPKPEACERPATSPRAAWNRPGTTG